MEREDAADAIAQEVLLAVRRTFITPFDRSDIRGLINSMDDAIDQMQKTAKAILLFEAREFSPQMREMGDEIVEAAEVTRRAVALLNRINKNAVELGELTQTVNTLEDRSDAVYDAKASRPCSRLPARMTRWATSSAPRSTTTWKR